MLIFEKPRGENNWARHSFKFRTETLLIVRSVIRFYCHYTDFSPRGSEKLRKKHFIFSKILTFNFEIHQKEELA